MTLATELGATPRVPAERSVRQVVSNAASLLFAYVLPRVFTFGAVIVAARVLGIADFGVYGTAAAYAVILSIIATLGMTPLLIREIAREPARAASLVRAAHLVKTVTNAVMLLALTGVAVVVLRYPPTVVYAALLLGVAYAIGAYVENLAAYFQAVERMHIWLQASAAYGLVTGGLGTLLVLATGSLVVFCVAPVIGQLAAFLWLAWRSPPGIAVGRPTSRRDLAHVVSGLVPFAVSFVALTIYYKADVLLLADRWPAGEVGVYTAGFKFVDITIALATVAVGAVYPRLSRAAVVSDVGDREAAGRLAELALVVAVPLAALLWLLRAHVVALVFGSDYAAAVPVVALLVPALPALVLNFLASYVLGAARRMQVVAWCYGAALVLNVGLNLVFMPALGATGAALAKLCSELVLGIGLLAALWLYIGAMPRARCLGVVTVAAVAAAAAEWSSSTAGVAPVLAGYVLLVSLLYRHAAVVTAEEWAVLRAALRRPPRPAPVPLAETEP